MKRLSKKKGKVKLLSYYSKKHTKVHVVSIVILLIIMIVTELHVLGKDLAKIEAESIARGKKELFSIVDNYEQIIKLFYNEFEDRLEKNIISDTQKAIIDLESKLLKDRRYSEDEIVSIIRKHLLKRNQSNGYFFVFDTNTNCVINQRFPELENKPLSDFEYEKEISKIISSKDDGFVKGYMYHTQNHKRELKYSYLKKIPNYNYYVGMGDYFNLRLENYKQFILAKLSLLNSKNNYLFSIYDISNASLIFYNNKLVKDGSVYVTKGQEDEKRFEDILRVIQKDGQGYIYETKQSKEKLLCVKKNNELNWVIGFSNRDDINKTYAHAKIKSTIINTFSRLFIYLVFLISFLIISKRINKKELNDLASFFEKLKNFMKNYNNSEDYFSTENCQFRELSELVTTMNDFLSINYKKSENFMLGNYLGKEFFQKNPQPIVLFDKMGTVLDVNENFTIVFGYLNEEIRGKHISILTNDIVEKKKIDAKLKLLLNGKVEKYTATRLTKRNYEKIFDICNIPILMNNNVEYIFSIYIDNTDTVKNQIALKIASGQSLEAAKTKAQFLANMSHEIRTPMNGVIGMTDLLLKTTLTEEQKEYIDTIKVSGDSLLRVINDILDFSKLEAGKYNYHNEPLVIEQCIEESIATVSNGSKNKDVSFYYSMGIDVPRVIECDFLRLKQILINLIGNSNKFTRHGHIIVRVSLIADEQDTVTLKFENEDTGIGIEKEKLKKIFGSFSQADNSTSRKFGGTGLGLSIAKIIINDYDGNMWVESKLGFGTTFYFTMTCKKSDQTSELSRVEKFSYQNIITVCDIKLHEQLKTNLLSNGDKIHNYRYLSETKKDTKIDILFITIDKFKENFELISQRFKENKLGSVVILKKLLDKKININCKCKQKIYYLNIPLQKEKLFQTIEYSLKLRVLSDNKRKQELIDIRKDINILVAEDNIINQKLMKKMFSKLGYLIDLAKDGKEALAMTKEKRYDIVFMDLQMPNMDGLEATKLIRERMLNEAPLIVALTANVLPEDKEKCIDYGMVDFLPKPVRVLDINEMLKKYFSE